MEHTGRVLRQIGRLVAAAEPLLRQGQIVLHVAHRDRLNLRLRR